MQPVQLLQLPSLTVELYVQDGQALVRHGETGVRFFVIRYGTVSVMRPLPEGGQQEVAIMRRGQFVGERTLITGALAPASLCIGVHQPCRQACGGCSNSQLMVC